MDAGADDPYGRGMSWDEVYARCVEGIVGIGEGPGADDPKRPVPATPRWTIHEVVAHLAGVGHDAVTGRMDGAPSPAWTERHVAERAATPLPDLLAELRSNLPALAPMLRDNPRPALVWDASTHLADLHEALGLGVPPVDTWHPVLEAVAPPDLRERFGVPDDVPAYEVLRGRFSRRSRRQLLAWGMAEAALEEFGIFGARDDDQPVP